MGLGRLENLDLRKTERFWVFKYQPEDITREQFPGGYREQTPLAFEKEIQAPDKETAWSVYLRERVLNRSGNFVLIDPRELEKYSVVIEENVRSFKLGDENEVKTER